MRTNLLVAAAALALFTTPALAGEHPDMSGTWTIDPATSDFGPMPAPTDIVVTIKVDGEDYSLSQTGGGQPPVNLRFSTSGKEVTNELPDGAKMTSTHRWESQSVMVGDIKIVTGDGTTITMKDHMTFSPDAKVITQKRTLNGPMGEAQMTIVLNRK